MFDRVTLRSADLAACAAFYRLVLATVEVEPNADGEGGAPAERGALGAGRYAASVLDPDGSRVESSAGS